MGLKSKVHTFTKISAEKGLGDALLTARSRLLHPFAPDEPALVLGAFAKLAQTGIMLDVGAHYGTSLLPFARAGWQVYAFEPDHAKPRFADYPCRLKSPHAWGNIFAVQEQEPALYQALVQSCKAQHPF